MKTLVTGGCSFIGSHLVEKLVEMGDEVFVIDDLSSGSLENFTREILPDRDFRVSKRNLREWAPVMLEPALKGMDRIFHLAADHGGRGYVEERQIACSNNFAIDNNVLQAALLAEVPRMIFASSGCIYPTMVQEDVNTSVLLTEEDASIEVQGELKHDAGSFYYSQAGVAGGGLWGAIQPDGLYGLAKLAMEMSLEHAFRENDLSSVSCRFFTVYGPRAKENHAIMSFIARAFTKQDPWIVWGDGSQVRNWTYVDDIVDGMISSADHPLFEKGAHQINLGTSEEITVRDAVREVIMLEAQRLSGTKNLHAEDFYNPTITYDETKPTGPLNRVADNSFWISLTGIEPMPFTEGLKRTFDWYYETKDSDFVSENFERLLIERQ